MNILFIGDIVGASGRKVVGECLPYYRDMYDIDLVIANGENAAHGKGLTPKVVDQLLALGIDVLTLGNHAYAKKDVYLLDGKLPICFPGNMSGRFSDRHTYVLEKDGFKLAVSSVYGAVFMDNVAYSPFELMDDILNKYPEHMHIVDFHGEATAEKQVFMHYYKDKVAAIVGTHTHVQTADHDIFNGCAYISDVGMCGGYQSILGRDLAEATAKMVHQESTYYKPSNNPAIFSGVVMSFDSNQRAQSIQRIFKKPSQKCVEK